MHTQSIVSSSMAESPRDGSVNPHPGTGRRVTSKYLLEMARTFSIEMGGSPVLCTDFFPGLDLTLSAAGEVRSAAHASAEAQERRFREVVDLVRGTEAVLKAQPEWFRQQVSFGVVRWWPVAIRDTACHWLGPFRSVIDCETRWVRFNDV